MTGRTSVGQDSEYSEIILYSAAIMRSSLEPLPPGLFFEIGEFLSLVPRRGESLCIDPGADPMPTAKTSPLSDSGPDDGGYGESESMGDAAP